MADTARPDSTIAVVKRKTRQPLSVAALYFALDDDFGHAQSSA